MSIFRTVHHFCCIGDVTALGPAFKAGLEAVMKYGGARVGDRTMVDALSPAVSALLLDDDTTSFRDRVENAAEAGEKGARATLSMTASAGRASYVAASQLVYPDPGAHAVAIILRAICDSFK